MTKNEKKPVAVALQYEHPGTPKVIAKGREEVAEAIIKTAREHNIAIEQNAELAVALSTVELDEKIPIELYKAVAQVIGFVTRVARRKR